MNCAGIAPMAATLSHVVKGASEYFGVVRTKPATELTHITECDKTLHPILTREAPSALIFDDIAKIAGSTTAATITGKLVFVPTHNDFNSCGFPCPAWSEFNVNRNSDSELAVDGLGKSGVAFIAHINDRRRRPAKFSVSENVARTITNHVYAQLSDARRHSTVVA